MNQIQTAFNEVVAQDLATISDQKFEYFGGKMIIGPYDEIDAIDGTHLDYEIADTKLTVRYLVAVVGPGTDFYEGVITADRFDDGELIAGPPITETAKTVAVPTGVVIRFISMRDPHCVPDVSEPTFRILCNQTVAVS
jgi:hypothetical protein